MQYDLDILVDGKEMKWYATENAYSKFKGWSAFTVQKMSDKFYDYQPADGAVSPIPEVKYDKTIEAAKEVFGNKTDAPKELNLPGRGAAWNNAFDWCLMAAKKANDKDDVQISLTDFLKEVAQVAAKIAPEQERFVQNIQEDYPF